VIRELVDVCDFSLELWNFQVLAVPEIGNSAAKAAAQADFVTPFVREAPALDAEPEMVEIARKNASSRPFQN
jgi:hypothetical protein